MELLERLQVLRDNTTTDAVVTISTKTLNEIIGAMTHNIIALNGADRIGEFEKDLTFTESRILKYLWARRDTMVDPERLVNAAGTTDEKALWVHIRRLRVKLEELGAGIAIVTVRKRGYMAVDMRKAG